MATEVLNDAKPFFDGVRPEIRSLPRYNAGLSIDYVRKHYGVSTIAKLGSNENPYGPSPAVLAAVTKAVSDIALYPEASCDSLRVVLSEHLGVEGERLIFGNGSEDLIAVAVHAFLSPGSKVVTFAPSFGLHVIWPNSVGAVVQTVPVTESYAMDVEEVIAALKPDTRMLIFGNPSNPVGTSLKASDLRRILEHLSTKTLVIFDEAYLEYARADASYPDFLAILGEYEIPWLLLRTLSKAYGLAGLRIGYAVASDRQLIDLMDRVRAPFNVNHLAQVGAIAALGDMAYVDSVVERTVVERERVQLALQSLGLRIAPSLTNFLFVDVRESAADVAQRLLTKGVIVKPWSEPAFRNHIRVSIGSTEANDQFLGALTTLVF